MATEEPLTYAIKIQGKLKEEWSDWFCGMTITFAFDSEESPVTTLVGPVADQAALRGILTRVWDLNLAVIAVQQLETASARS